MNANFFSYLIESSVYLLFFLIIYRLTLSKQTHFVWMRGYLIISLILSLVLPMVTIPEQWSHALIGQNVQTVAFPIDVINPYTLVGPNLNSTIAPATNASLWTILIWLFSITYLAGVVFKSFSMYRNVRKIVSIIKSTSRHKEGAYWFINSNIDLPAFTFFRYIFINAEFGGLSKEDIWKIKKHEIIHAKQLHTLDVLFVEIVAIVFWFSPLVKYTKRTLQEIHEFIADEATAGQGEMKRNYAQLLLNLATENKFTALTTGFSGKQITKRITMVTKTKSTGRTKVLFLLILPASFLLLISFANPGRSDGTTLVDEKIVLHGGPNYATVRNVKWVNNKIFSNTELDKALDLKKGDKYVRENMKPKWNIYTDRITGLYSTKNYLFTDIGILETPVNSNEVDLTITISEGKLGKFGSIQIIGNETVPTAEIESKLTFKSGDQFNIIKMLESERAISTISKLNPDKITSHIAPQKNDPKDEFITINVGFQVTEK